MTTFQQFFTTATCGDPPYGYQRRLAEDSDCRSRLIELSAGLGKTTIIARP